MEKKKYKWKNLTETETKYNIEGRKNIKRCYMLTSIAIGKIPIQTIIYLECYNPRIAKNIISMK